MTWWDQGLAFVIGEFPLFLGPVWRGLTVYISISNDANKEMNFRLGTSCSLGGSAPADFFFSLLYSSMPFTIDAVCPFAHVSVQWRPVQVIGHKSGRGSWMVVMDNIEMVVYVVVIVIGHFDAFMWADSDNNTANAAIIKPRSPEN